jgi:VWFA-related protein
MRALLAVLLALAPQLHETITVERIIVDARVTDGRGNPILGLTAADFRVLVDGKPSKVESVDWVPDTVAARELADLEKPPAQVNNNTLEGPPPAGRLFVLFFQNDIGRDQSRVSGHLKFLLNTDDLLSMLDPEDRVAVFSFDSHLKFRLDFTNSQRDIRSAMESAMLFDEPNWPQVVPMPSLAKRLDPEAMKKAASAESALLLVANALRPIPGPKSLLLIGWGLGRFGSSGVHMIPAYGPAMIALEAARTSVFSLDITDADYHSLEVGLGAISGDTGGFYEKTNRFPKQSLDRLQKTLAGHYELEVRKPEGKMPAGYHTIEVQTTRRGAEVFARSSYVD